MNDDRSIIERLHDQGAPAPRVSLRGTEQLRAERRTGRFELVGELAEGGVGIVYKGRDLDIGREVAVKILRERYADHPELVQRLVEEAQIAGQLQHPGVVPIYELGLDADERPYFAMKLVKGSTLAALLADRDSTDTDRRRFLRVFEQVCQTIAYAHARGVVHRDLKPSNVQVLDWGFAKVLKRGGVADERAPEPPTDFTTIETLRSFGEGSNSMPGSVMGTPSYMPPEQAMGQVDLLDSRSDVFSLGAILCEILTGDPPYSRIGREAIIQAAQADLQNARDALAPCGELGAFALEAMTPQRDERPKDARFLSDAIARYLAEQDERAHEALLDEARARAEAGRADAAEKHQLRARKQTLRVAVAAVLAVVVGGASLWWASEQQRAEQDRIEEAVQLALEEASAAEGNEDYAAAIRAAERAESLSGGRGAVLLARVRDSKAERDRQQAKLVARQKLLGDLERIREERGEHNNIKRVDDAYSAAFREFGVPIRAGAGERLRSRLPTEEERIDVSTTLDLWTFLRRSKPDLQGSDWQILQSTADELDPHPLRMRIRRAILESDEQTVRELAREALEARLPAPTLYLFGGVALAHDGNEALKFWEQAVQIHPRDRWLRVGLAQRYGRGDESDAKKALAHAQAAVAVAPDSVMARNVLSEQLINAGRAEEALKFASRSKEIHPNAMYPLVSETVAVSRLRGTADGLALAQKHASDRPDIPRLATSVAICLLNEDRAKEALEVLQRIPERRRGSRYYVVLCMVARKLRNRDLIESASRWILGNSPGHPTGLIGYAEILMLDGQLDEAQEHITRALRANPRNHDTLRSAASIAYQSGDHSGSASLFRRALQAQQRCARCTYMLIGVLNVSGKHAEATRLAEDATTEFPDMAFGWRYLLTRRMAEGEYHDALMIGRRALRHCRGPEIFASVSHVLHDNLFDADSAIKIARTGLEEHPGHQSIRFQLGVALVRAGRPDLGLVELKQISSFRGWADLWRGVAMSLTQQPGAADELQRACTAMPSNEWARGWYVGALMEAKRLDEARAQVARLTDEKWKTLSIEILALARDPNTPSRPLVKLSWAVARRSYARALEFARATPVEQDMNLEAYRLQNAFTAALLTDPLAHEDALRWMREYMALSAKDGVESRAAALYALKMTSGIWFVSAPEHLAKLDEPDRVRWAEFWAEFESAMAEHRKHIR